MTIPRKLPAGGPMVVKSGSKYLVYLMQAVELGELETGRSSAGRRVYATPDGRLFTDAQAAAEHLATLRPVKIQVDSDPTVG